MPMMVAVEIDMALRCEQMKGREFQIVERLDGPTIAPIGIHKTFGEQSALSQTIPEPGEFGISGYGLIQAGQRFTKRGTGGRTHRSILMPKQLLRFCGPGH